MARTPLVSPGEYFARSDAFALRRAVAPTVAFWLVGVAITALTWVASDFGWTGDYVRMVFNTIQTTLLTLLVLTLVVYVLGQVTGDDGQPVDALVLAAWGMVPAIVGRLGFLIAAIGPIGGLDVTATTSTDIAVAVAFALVACLWAGYCWRDGFRYAFGLERAVATPTAVLAVSLCALVVIWPLFV